MREQATWTEVFHAETGAEPYDVIDFSARPMADLVYHRPSALSIVRHMGMQGSGLAWSKSHKKHVATMTLDLSAVGSFRGDIGGMKVDRPLRRGQISFVPADTPIELEYPAAHSCLHLSLPAARLSEFLATTGGDPFEPIICEQHDRVAQMIWMIDRELRDPGFASDLMVDGLVRAITTLIARHVDPQPPRDERIWLSPPKLKRVVDHIEAHLDQTLTLTELAAIAGLSVFHFSRMFKLATGESPYHFVGSRRLARAERLLRESDTPLSELALDCGFASQSHFNAAFRKALGVSPGRYRREHRK